MDRRSFIITLDSGAQIVTARNTEAAVSFEQEKDVFFNIMAWNEHAVRVDVFWGDELGYTHFPQSDEVISR